MVVVAGFLYLMFAPFVRGAASGGIPGGIPGKENNGVAESHLRADSAFSIFFA
jgi:hypothetical protein